jgi:glutathione peroxidase
MSHGLGILGLGILAGFGLASASGAGEELERAAAVEADASASHAEGLDALGFTMNRIDGTPQDLGAYRGRVVLIVNVASRCGFTPQYAGLERLYERYRERGFVVLGFPANDFGNQEPGPNAEIAKFCRSKYGVRFPMFEKISVRGEDMHPLYRRITSLPAPLGGPVKWNFQKYLLDRGGAVVARFPSATSPDAPELVTRLEALLEESG